MNQQLRDLKSALDMLKMAVHSQETIYGAVKSKVRSITEAEDVSIWAIPGVASMPKVMWQISCSFRARDLRGSSKTTRRQ